MLLAQGLMTKSSQWRSPNSEPQDIFEVISQPSVDFRNEVMGCVVGLCVYDSTFGFIGAPHGYVPLTAERGWDVTARFDHCFYVGDSKMASQILSIREWTSLHLAADHCVPPPSSSTHGAVIAGASLTTASSSSPAEAPAGSSSPSRKDDTIRWRPSTAKAFKLQQHVSGCAPSQGMETPWGRNCPKVPTSQ